MSSKIERSFYEEQFDRFVVKQDYKNLFGVITFDYFLPFLIKNSEYKFKRHEGVPSLLTLSMRNFFEQSKNDKNKCMIYDSLYNKIVFFKRELGAVIENKECFHKEFGEEIMSEMGSWSFNFRK